jgi:hypothetical protein
LKAYLRITTIYRSEHGTSYLRAEYALGGNDDPLCQRSGHLRPSDLFHEPVVAVICGVFGSTYHVLDRSLVEWIDCVMDGDPCQSLPQQGGKVMGVDVLNAVVAQKLTRQ